MKRLVLVLVLLSFILVGCLGSDNNNNNAPVFESDVSEEQFKALQDEVDILFATIGQLEDIIFENESKISELEAKALANFQAISLVEFDLKWLAGDTVGFTEDMFLELQQIKLAIKELDLMYNALYYDELLMTETFIRRTDELSIVMEVVEGQIVHYRVYTPDGWEDVAFTQTQDLYFKDTMTLIKVIDDTLEAIRVLGAYH